MHKKLIIIILLFTSHLFYAQYTDVVNSNRPSKSMSAFAVGKTVFQIESGLNYINEKDETFLDETYNYKASGVVADVNLRYGFLKEQLEAILEVSYQDDTQKFNNQELSRSGLKTTTIGAKYLVYDPFKYQEETVNLYSWKKSNKFKFSQLIPVVALYAGINVNFSTNKFYIGEEKSKSFSPKVMLITQNIIGKQFVFITNTFFDKLGTNRSQLGYILTLTKGINNHWSGFAEYRGLSNKFYKDNFVSAGGAYLLNGNFQIDASVSKNLKDKPSILFGGIGITWRSDFNYEEELIRMPNKAKSEKSKKDELKKKNQKKMLDKFEESNEKEKK